MRNMFFCATARNICFTCLLVFMINTSIGAASLESAHNYYNAKDYRAAIAEYKTMLSLNWPKTQLGEIYEHLSECLLITEDFDEAAQKTNEFIALALKDPNNEIFDVRLIQIAVNRGDYQTATRLANVFLSKHSDDAGTCTVLVNKLFSEAKAGKPDFSTVNLATAANSFAEKNYGRAAAQYSVLLNKDKTLMDNGEFIDRMTESLAIVGKYSEAMNQIETFIGSHSADPTVKNLMARKTQVSFWAKDYPTAIQNAKNFLAIYKEDSDACLPVEMKLIEALRMSNKHQELVDYIDQTLDANPNHPLYADLRIKQGDALADSLKRDDDAVAKFKDGMDRAKPDSEAYEICSYRAGEVLFKQVRALGKTDPKRADDMTSRGCKFYEAFVNHPCWDKHYPGNARRRLVALKKLKRYDEMEKEAAQYLSGNNRIRYNEKTSVIFIVGGFLIEPVGSGNAGTDAAFKEIRTNFYSEKYPKTIELAREFLAMETEQNPQFFQVQRILVGALAKSGGSREMIEYVDKVLADSPNHPMYAEFRRAEGDALFDVLKQESAAIRKYEDAMAHSDKNSDIYDWCCYRAGDAMFKHASAVAKVDRKLADDVKIRGRVKFEEYVDLPSKDRIYPANVQRRVMAFNRLGKYDDMEREATRYLMDEGINNVNTCIQLLRIMSVSQAMREKPNEKGAFAAFEQLRMKQSQIGSPDVKFNCGIAMIRAADRLRDKGSDAEDVKKLRESGMNFLRDCANDESMRGTNQLDAYYYLGDWTSMKAVATKKLNRADQSDAFTRTEMMNWIGIAMANQQPRDVDGALASFEQVMQEYDRNPKLVKDHSVVAVYWSVYVLLSKGDLENARALMRKVASLPDCDMKNQLVKEYGHLLRQTNIQ